MTSRRSFIRLSLCSLAAAVAASALGWQKQNAPPTNEQCWSLYADLWMQTSGEYVACCLQTYKLAAAQLERDVQELQGKQEGLAPKFRTPAPAVIMDLDETVLDNSAYETYLYDTGQNFTAENFSKFMTDHGYAVRLVPGAKDFIDRAEALGVTVVYITDRPEEIRKPTIETLSLWGIDIKGTEDVDSRLLMAQKGEANKTRRRDVARAKYSVLMLLGDQLGDFTDEFNPHDSTIASRREAVYEDRGKWGTNWFILPQPVYGQWQKLLQGDPAQYLRRLEK